MNYMGVNEIRQSFLDFFESKGHLARKSYPLVPENDKSLLLINAGMAPMKNYFVGIETPPNKRMVTCQKCMRTGDIENVGRTARHATFFEMLGNFSFGDYFKKEAIAWAWEYCTVNLGLKKEDLWITVYEEDDEAFDIWEQDIGIAPNMIVRLGKEDNFWEIGNGTGPCGPCSEIYIDRGQEFGCGKEDCKPGCDCDRFLEFWNLVFTQFDKDENGVYNPLPNPNIDTGMGLERIACIMQDVESIFDIDTMKNIRNKVCDLSQVPYGTNHESDVSIRVITDHARAVTFLISDGVLPSNEGRGYVLRRILRRAARHGKLHGIKGNFLFDLVDVVVENYGEAYEELLQKKDFIKKIITLEENKFAETLEQGLVILREEIEAIKKSGSTVLTGEKAFKLYDTFGFPVELTLEILEEENIQLDRQGFDVEMKSQRERARAARNEMNMEGWQGIAAAMDADAEKTEFLGYDFLDTMGELKDIILDDELSSDFKEGQKGILIFDKTPFYAESGGQVGDVGEIVTENFVGKIVDVKKSENGLFLHYTEAIKGNITPGTMAELKVDVDIRRATQRNHTATHLLHKALKEVLGSHVNQAGSLVNSKRLRFDFHHFEAPTKEELQKIEKLVNKKIYENLDVITQIMSIDEAKKTGAMALFDEKYDDLVRVLFVGDFSTELCGGTHVKNSSEIGMFKILSEGGIAAGVRRIEAITGSSVYEYLLEKDIYIHRAKELLKTNEDDFTVKLGNSLEELRSSKKALDKLKIQMATDQTSQLANSGKEIKGVKYISGKFEGMDEETLRTLTESLIDNSVPCVVLLGSSVEDKVYFSCMANKEAVNKGVHAGKFIKEVAAITLGGGGGRPNMAQAGGKDVSKLSEAIEKSGDILEMLMQ